MPVFEIPSEGWESLRPGVRVHWLYRNENGNSAAFLRYDPGASVPLHRHPGYEHIFVLDGSQQDETREYGTGSFALNEPGSVHSVRSPDGCTVLIVWTKPVQFIE